MELLLGAGIVLVVLAVVYASRTQAPAANLTDDGLTAQITAVNQWIAHHEAMPASRRKPQQQARKQAYLAELKHELAQRQSHQVTPTRRAG